MPWLAPVNGYETSRRYLNRLKTGLAAGVRRPFGRGGSAVGRIAGAPQPTAFGELLGRKRGETQKVIVADQQGHTLDMNLNVYTQTTLESRIEAVQQLESALIN